LKCIKREKITKKIIPSTLKSYKSGWLTKSFNSDLKVDLGILLLLVSFNISSSFFKTPLKGVKILKYWSELFL
jgi:hypothetical protein